MPHPSRPFSLHPLEKELESIKLDEEQKSRSQKDVPNSAAQATTSNPKGLIRGLWDSHKESLVTMMAFIISILTAVNFYVLFQVQSALGELRAVKAASDSNATP
jgi:hypothetical protein